MPHYVFRIDNMEENHTIQPLADATGTWLPSTAPGSNILKWEGITGSYWWCNNQTIKQISDLPKDAMHFRTYSIYYNQGFWLSECDASRTDVTASPWQRLNIDHDNENYSSHLTNAGQNSVLRTQRPSQRWPDKLLPNIYHAPRASWTADEHTGYGGLTGELPIFLGLIAFSIPKEHSAWAISKCFSGGKFQLHDQPNGSGWVAGRGMVVRVWTFPGQSTTDDLEDLENGVWGQYFD